jgi:hypothetical protein
MSGVIKLIKYKVKAGVFAVDETTLYRVDVIGLDGSVRYGNPYIDIKYAKKEAEEWRSFTGFRVIKVEISKMYTEIETEML